MNKNFSLWTLLLFSLSITNMSGFLFAKEILVTFNVIIPANTPTSDVIFLYGSMNNWDPGPTVEPDSTDLALELAPSGMLQIKINLTARSTYHYKYTRGSLETIENNVDSSESPMRSVFIDDEIDPLVFFDTVYSWTDLTQPPKPENGTPVLTFYNNSPQTDIAVTWVSESFAENKIFYGINDLNENMIEVNEHYDLINPGDNLIHNITLTNLQQNTLYKYKVVTEGVYESDQHVFKTADYSDKFSFVVMGDNRPGIDTNVMKGTINDNPKFVLHAGDLVQYGVKISYWFDLFKDWAPMLNTIPTMAIYGNHEADSYLNRFFKFPANSSTFSDNWGHWYSFDYNNVHIIALDCYRGYTEGTEQYNWLIDDLENISSVTDFVCVLIHEPPYTSGIGHRSNLDIREKLVPVFEKYNVDIVFSGHEHIYEKSKVNGIYYIISGGAGSPLYNLQTGSNEYSIYAETTYHYCRVNIDGGNLLLEMVRSNGTIGDSFKIEKKKETPTVTSFSLLQNFPNPFNPITKIKFTLPESAYISLKIYDILGSEVTTLVDEKKTPGVYEVRFNANAAGEGLASGVYFAVLSDGSNTATIKLLLLK